ncbi:MAG: T9SS type A sorting domain-containing protein [Candidatus Stygibacter australis]|nr:T9SS type A sorting domain-containing protein [Candidatus Stygibacter australis]
MRKTILLLLVLGLITGLWGYTAWEENGMAIRQETNLYWEGTDAQLSDGSSVIIWSDAANGEQEMRAQRIDTEGNILWDENAVQLVNTHFITHGYTIKVSNDDIYISWLETYNTYQQRLRVQKLNESGEILWGETGLIVSSMCETLGCSYNMECDAEGNTYYLLNCEEDAWYQVRVIKLDPNGETCEGWSSDGITMTNLDNSQDEGAMIIAGENIFCMWADDRSNNFRNYYQLFSPSGEELLTENGELLFEDALTESIPVLYSTAEGKVIIYSFVFGNEGNDLRIKCINEAGENAWENDLIMDNYHACHLKLVPSGEDEYFCSWVSYQDAHYTWFSKFNIDGEIIGEPIVVSSNTYFGVSDFAADQNGGLWYCQSENSPPDIWLQHLNSEMEEMFEPGGRLIFDQGRRGFYPQLLQCEETEVMLGWYGDCSSEQRIYLQKVDNAGNLEYGEEAEYIYSQLSGSVDGFSIAGCDEFTAISWIDTRSDSVIGEVYLQIVDNATGEKRFAENGICVSNGAGRRIVMALSEDNTRIGIGFRKWGNNGIYFQMTDIEGNIYFDDAGLRLIEEEVEFLNNDLQIITEGDGFNLAWSGHLFENEVALYRQRVTAAGLQWGLNGLVYQDFPAYSDCSTEALVEDYCLIMNDEYNQSSLLIARFDENGDVYPGWEMPGVNLSGAKEFLRYHDAELISDQLLVIWYERIDMTDRNIYGQLVNPDGSIEWEEEGRLLLTDSAAPATISDLEIIDNNTFLISTKQMDTFNLKIQKFNLEGEQLWENNGVEPFAQEHCSGHEISYNNGVISVYAKFILENDNYDIYGAFYDLDGNLWEGIPEIGFPVCNIPKDQGYFQLSTDSAGDNYLVWSDSRAEFYQEEDPSLYMQKIEVPTVAVGDDEIVSFIEINNYPNPFVGKTYLSYELPRSEEDVFIEIYNIKGQLINKIPAGQEGAEWDCRNMQGRQVGSGVYFYQLKGENLQSQAHKMILLR